MALPIDELEQTITAKKFKKIEKKLHRFDSFSSWNRKLQKIDGIREWKVLSTPKSVWFVINGKYVFRMKFCAPIVRGVVGHAEKERKQRTKLKCDDVVVKMY